MRKCRCCHSTELDFVTNHNSYSSYYRCEGCGCTFRVEIPRHIPVSQHRRYVDAKV